MGWVRDLFDPVATEPQPEEIGEEIAMERDPVTGAWREMGGDEQ